MVSTTAVLLPYSGRQVYGVVVSCLRGGGWGSLAGGVSCTRLSFLGYSGLLGSVVACRLCHRSGCPLPRAAVATSRLRCHTPNDPGSSLSNDPCLQNCNAELDV